MKKVILSLAFLGATSSLFANTNPTTAKTLKAKPVECTVSATVNVGGTGVSISSTKPTCAEAVKDVASGVKAVLNQF